MCETDFVELGNLHIVLWAYIIAEISEIVKNVEQDS